MSHTEDSQILGAPVQKKLAGQCCTQDACTSVVVTQWSLRRCKKEMRPVCRYIQHLFHRSYGTAGGRNKPLLEVVFGLEGWMMGHHLLVTLPGMFLVLAVTVHMLLDIMGP